MPKRNHWHVIDARQEYVLARRLPIKFDVEACADFPSVDKARLALQLRQDLWREMQSLRGFSPVIHISASKAGLLVKAGGQCDVVPPGTARKIADLLNDPLKRVRWIKCATRRSRASARSLDRPAGQDPISARRV